MVSLFGEREAGPAAATFTPTSQLHHIHGLAVDPRTPGILYIATHGGLVRFVEGKRWEMVGEERSDFMGFTLHPAQQGIMYASGHPAHSAHRPNPMGVIVSRDGGQSWQPLALAGLVDFHAMTLSPMQEVLYGWNVTGTPGLYRVSTSDGTWTRIEARGLRDIFSVAAHPAQRETLLAGTKSGLVLSQDGGQSWTPLHPTLAGVPVTVAVYHPRDPQILYAYAVGEGLGVLRSDDSGKTWTPMGLFLGAKDAAAVLAVSPGPSEELYLSSFSSDLYRSTDGGKSWTLLAKQGKPVGS
jgi:photosystem II stability/assembly factor-like uncharacterized protein